MEIGTLLAITKELCDINVKLDEALKNKDDTNIEKIKLIVFSIEKGEATVRKLSRDNDNVETENEPVFDEELWNEYWLSQDRTIYYNLNMVNRGYKQVFGMTFSEAFANIFDENNHKLRDRAQRFVKAYESVSGLAFWDILRKAQNKVFIARIREKIDELKYRYKEYTELFGIKKEE